LIEWFSAHAAAAPIVAANQLQRYHRKPVWPKTSTFLEITDIQQSIRTNAKPHDDRRASQDRHIAVASFRRVTATYAGVLSPA